MKEKTNNSELNSICDKHLLVDWLDGCSSRNSKIISEHIWGKIQTCIENELPSKNIITSSFNKRVAILLRSFFSSRLLPVVGAGASLATIVLVLQINKEPLNQNLASNVTSSNFEIKIINDRPRVVTSNSPIETWVKQKGSGRINGRNVLKENNALIPSQSFASFSDNRQLFASASGLLTLEQENQELKSKNLSTEGLNEGHQNNSLCASLNLPENCLSQLDNPYGK